MDGLGLDADAKLCPPPPPILSTELSPAAIPDAWTDGEATVKALLDAVSAQRGYPVPWGLIRAGVEAAVQVRLFEVDPSGGPWPCTASEAARVRIRLPQVVELDAEDLIGPAAEAAWNASTTTLGAIRDAIEKQRGRRLDDKLFAAAVDDAIRKGLFVREGASPGYEASVRIRRRATTLTAEGPLNAFELQRVGELVTELSKTAPAVKFNFHLLITVEDQEVDADTRSALNEILAQASPKLRFG
jgi:hypothetical protein